MSHQVPQNGFYNVGTLSSSGYVRSADQLNLTNEYNCKKEPQRERNETGDDLIMARHRISGGKIGKQFGKMVMNGDVSATNMVDMVVNC